MLKQKWSAQRSMPKCEAISVQEHLFCRVSLGKSTFPMSLPTHSRLHSCFAIAAAGEIKGWGQREDGKGASACFSNMGNIKYVEQTRVRNFTQRPSAEFSHASMVLQPASKDTERKWTAALLKHFLPTYFHYSSFSQLALLWQGGFEGLCGGRLCHLLRSISTAASQACSALLLDWICPLQRKGIARV